MSIRPAVTNVTFPKIFKPMLESINRYVVLYGGRGSGKSHSVAKHLILQAINGRARILCCREIQKTIRQSVHKLLSLQIEEMGLKNLFTITHDTIRCKNGSEFIFMGFKHNIDDIRSLEGVTHAWCEEASTLSQSSFDALDPTIRAEGSQLFFTFNPRFKSDCVYRTFVDKVLLDDVLIIKANYNDNPFLPDVLKKQQREMKKKDPDKHNNIWLGELRTLSVGSIFGRQIIEARNDNRWCYLPVEKNKPVHMFFDIGKNDHTSIWFMQIVGNRYNFIDFFQDRLEEVQYYTKYIKSLPYLMGTAYLPHDADHERLGMVRNIRQQFEDGGVNPIEIVPVISHKLTAIDLAREVFPSCFFHKGDDERGKRMEDGWSALSNYRWMYNDEKDMFSEKPYHDHNSNPADAFMQFAQIKDQIAVNMFNPYSDWSKPIN